MPQKHLANNHILELHMECRLVNFTKCKSLLIIPITNKYSYIYNLLKNKQKLLDKLSNI